MHMQQLVQMTNLSQQQQQQCMLAAASKMCGSLISGMVLLHTTPCPAAAAPAVSA
jgi:hypothetical protein